MSLPPLVGHNGPLTSLRQALRRGRFGQAYLFVGPAGIGKRRAALEVARGLLCEAPDRGPLDPCGRCAGCLQVAAGVHPDYLEVRRPADKNVLPIETIQTLCAAMSLKPARGARKVAVIDDADAMNVEAANCLLKTLEEPPPGVTLVLIAGSVESQLATIVSRCQALRFTELSDEQVAAILDDLLERGEQDDDTDFDRETVLQARAGVATAAGSVGLALALADPEWAEIRPLILESLTTVPVPSVPLTQTLAAFVDAAGNEAAPRRQRGRQLIRLATGIYQAALRSQQTGVNRNLSDADAMALARLTSRVPADTLVDLLDRCVQADWHISRGLSQSLSLAAWIDDLAQLTAGRLIEPVGWSVFDYPETI